MNATGIPLKEPEISAAAGDTEQVERALIDASTRVPVLMFYTSAIAWLFLGTLLAGFASWKLHSPDLLVGISFLDLWSRAPGAHEHDGLWLGVDGRNGNRDLADGALVPDDVATSAFARHRRGVLESRRADGVGGILLGDSTGYEWLEFPRLLRAHSFRRLSRSSMSWAVLMFRFRRGDHIYITQWYLLGAFLWFPWLYAAAQVMLFVVPVQGVMQAAVELVVREQSPLPLVRRDRARHGLLHDPESDRTPGLQLSSGDDRILDLRAFRELDRNAAADRWPVSGVDDHRQHRRHDPVASSLSRRSD